MFTKTVSSSVGLVLALLLLAPATADAHCDTLDGPVVKAAATALESGKLGTVLAWVQAGDEREIRAAFEHARKVRKLGPEARELADHYFFETLVRVHRAGEGAPYTGLKPAGLDPGPAVRAADEAVRTGSIAELEQVLVEAVRHGLHEKHEALRGKKAPGGDAASGREWVAAYVPFVHYAEGVYAAARGPGEHHEEKPASSSHERAKAKPAGHAH